MLKFKLDSLAELDESLHAHYEERDGAFFLKVEGAVAEDAVAGLKRNHDTLLAEKKEQQRLAQEAEAERKRIEEEAARKNGDLQAIEQSWREKLAARETELSERLKVSQQQIYSLTVGRQAQELAGKLAKPNAQRLLAKEIKERLSLDEDGNIRVLDKNGAPSALTIAELEQEMRLNPEYSDIIIVSNSSGGGATGGGFGGGATKKPEEYTIQEMKEMRASNPELYNRIFPLK